MNKDKNKSKLLPYVFGISWLLCMILFDWSIFRCAIVAGAVCWLIKSIPKNMQKKKEERTKAPLKEDKKPEPQPVKEDPKGTGNAELDAVLQFGRASVQRLQQINDDIPDYKVSAQLKQIEILTASIFDQVEKKSDRLKEVRQFMNYYLPTTIRLLEQYVQLQNVGLKGDNIGSAMQQIEEMLDKVIVAFQKQLDGMFERDVVDITADIQVMEQMMSAQGLTNTKDF